MHFFKALLIIAVVGLLGEIIFVATGIYDPAADDPHWPITYKLMEVTRDRGISVRASGIMAPPLGDPALIRQGAGNYNAMCSGCHLAPGMAETELHKGLYPAPPNLAELGVKDPARTFWVIKHGMKMSGMPAWGKSMQDPYIWGMVAFLQRLPTLTPEQYKEMSAGGHHHGGGEDHHHDGMEEAEHHHDEMDAGHHHHDEISMGDADHDHAATESAEHHHDGDDSAIDESAHGANVHAPDHADAAGHLHDHDSSESSHAHSDMQMNGMRMDTHADHSQGHSNAVMPGMKMTGAQMQANNTAHSHGILDAGTQGKAHSDMSGMDMGDMHGMNHSGMPAASQPKPIGPAEAAVNAFHDAVEIGNTNLALQWLAPDLVVEEDGHTEHSRAEYASSHLGADIAFLKASRVRALHASARVNGDSAIVTSQTRITSLPGHKTVDSISSETATLRKTSEGWRIVRLHWSSAPVPMDAPALQHH